MILICTAVLCVLLSVGGIYAVWRIGTLSNERNQLRAQMWKDYAERLQHESERDRQAEGVEADIDTLADSDVIERMCKAGYLTDCPKPERE